MSCDFRHVPNLPTVMTFRSVMVWFAMRFCSVVFFRFMWGWILYLARGRFLHVAAAAVDEVDDLVQAVAAIARPQTRQLHHEAAPTLAIPRPARRQTVNTSRWPRIGPDDLRLLLAHRQFSQGYWLLVGIGSSLPTRLCFRPTLEFSIPLRRPVPSTTLATLYNSQRLQGSFASSTVELRFSVIC